MARHESLGKVFAAFKLCAGLRWANHLHALQRLVGIEIVGDASHQRVFIAHHQYADAIVGGKLSHSVEVHRRKWHIGAILRSVGIAWSNVKTVEKFTLAQFPCDGTFAAT